MAGPFTAERQQQLGDQAREFMQEFSIEYLKMYGLAMFTRIKEEVEGVPEEKRLMYRDWKSIERPDGFKGECFMRSGEGPGAFGAWKKVYLVEQCDYNIGVYPDQKTFAAGKKPKKVIRTAGYSLESDPSWHYTQVFRDVAGSLGMEEGVATRMTTFSRYAWALAHPWRPNYMFQLHKSSGGQCACFGGGAVEPEDAGAEFEDQRVEYLKAFERFVALATPRDPESVSGRAFELTVGKMTAKFSNLSDFKDDGLESEILVDMLMQECLMPMRSEMLQEVIGPAALKLPLWYKTQGMIGKLLKGVAIPVWGTTQKAAQALGEKIEPQVRRGVEPILQIKEKVKDKIRAKVIDKMGNFLQKYVTPYINPILKAFDKPMTRGFEQAKGVFRQHVNIASLPDDKQQRNLELDAVPRTWSNVSDVSLAADELVDPLRKLKDLSQEVFADLDPAALRSMAEVNMLETLDAAIYTLECRIDENGKSERDKQQILQDFDHDVIVSRSDFVRNVVRSLLIGAFRKAIGPAVDPVIEGLDGNIPEEVQDYISVAGVFEELVDLFVGEPIDKMVEGAYPRPK